MFRGFDWSGARGSLAHRRRLACLLTPIAALFLALGVAGCGSSKPLTRAQLVSQANTLCTHVQMKMKKVGPAKTPAQFAKLADKLASFEQQQLESMRKLKPPSSLAADWKRMIEGAEEITEAVGTLSTDVQLKKDKAAAEELKTIGRVEQRITPIVQRDGFTRCKQLA
jgi:hypothetical protein